MPTKVIDKNESRVPFLGDKMSFIRGLDPLGLQNPSIQMYSYLLPGLNNVTNRLRYYSFYCWLLSEYAKRIKNTDPLEQKRFIRKAEYIIALASVKAGVEGIPGSNYATVRIHEQKDQYNLHEGTYNPDGTTDKTYWKYHFGVFGQYYVGSLRQLGLIDEPTKDDGTPLGIFRRTAKNKRCYISGEELAEAFNKNINQVTKETFFNAIKLEIIKTDELSSLIPEFNLTLFDPDSEEVTLLLKTLTDVDEPYKQQEDPLKMRRNTLYHLLKFIKDEDNKLSAYNFTLSAYKLQGFHNEKEDPSLTGWYYYQLNEYWQYACTGIFNGCIDFLEVNAGPGWMPLNDLINKSTESICRFLKDNKLIHSSEKKIDLIKNELKYSEEELKSSIAKEPRVGRMAYSFLLIWKLYENNKSDLNRLFEFTKDRKIIDGTDVISFYLKYDKYLSYSISKFIDEFLFKNIIYRHHYVAHRKMGTGSQSTQKFIIEENQIRKIDNFNPVNTSPRIGNLINFISDLRLVDKEKKLTDSGKKLTRKLEEE